MLFKAGTHIGSLFNSKAKKWVKGRRNVFKKLKETIPKNEKIVWIHCSSLGEFEQGRPVIERLKAQGTRHKILLTFFSPSGYDVKKNYDGADWIFYLPMDGLRNAKRFLEIVNPSLVIFVKYEFWYYYLKKIKNRNIPLLLISALFRKDMPFFKWYGGLQRKMLARFDHLFVQNSASKKLIDEIGLAGICSISGDTRFDRVIEIAEKFEPIPAIEQFIGNSKTIVAGSTWKQDEKLLQGVFHLLNLPALKLIIAPHETGDKHLYELKKLFPGSITFSELTSNRQIILMSRQREPYDILIIDNIGMLSHLYKYGYINYVGGGFTKGGVHNVLEAAVYGKPVFFGPNYKKYKEATDLIDKKGAVSISSAEDLANTFLALRMDPQQHQEFSKASKNYVQKNTGATEKIIQYIQEKRLLTS